MSNLTEIPDAPEEIQALGEEGQQIVEWRFGVLEQAGYNPIHARRIAHRAFPGRPDYIDLHIAVELVTSVDNNGKGCPPTIAADILL